MAAKLLVVGGEDNRVLARPVGADAVVGERLGGVEVEDEEEVSTLEDDDLVGLRGTESQREFFGEDGSVDAPRS